MVMTLETIWFAGPLPQVSHVISLSRNHRQPYGFQGHYHIWSTIWFSRSTTWFKVKSAPNRTYSTYHQCYIYNL